MKAKPTLTSWKEARRVIMALVVMTITQVEAQADFYGYYQNWTAVRTQGDYDFMLLRNRLRLNTSFGQESVGGLISLDVRNDEIAGQTEFEITLREAYVDLYLDRVDFRIGKQQVVWGKADGLFINDIVCPLDMRMFLLQDFDNIRMGLPMVKGSYYLGNWALEGLWIPEFKPWKFAQVGSDWEFQLGMADTVATALPGDWGPAMRLDIFHQAEPLLPEQSIDASEFGLRVSSFIFDTDVSILLLDAYNDFPMIGVDSTDTMYYDIVPLSSTLQVDWYTTPKYYRTRMYGLNFSRPVNRLVLRGEMGYYTGKHFFDLSGFDSGRFYSESDFFQGMIGFDLSGPYGVNISVQGIQQQIMDYRDTMVDDQVVHMATLMLYGSFWRETAFARALGIFDLNDEAGLAILSLDYKWVDGLTLSIGTYLLWGPEDSVFGQFDRNDNVFLKAKYNF